VAVVSAWLVAIVVRPRGAPWPATLRGHHWPEDARRWPVGGYARQARRNVKSDRASVRLALTESGSMSDQPCPACRYPNPPSSRRCEFCGEALTEGDTVPSPLTAAWAHEAGVESQVSALWFDDLGLPTTVPKGAGAAPPRPPDITVREIRFTSRSAAAPPTAPEVGPTASDPLPMSAQAEPPATPSLPQPALPLAGPAPSAEALPADRAARAVIKVARRAAVRRARQEAAPLPQPAGSDVLVMDVDATARNQLDELLGALGFRVRPVATLAQAALLAGHHPFAAVFVAVPPGTIDGAVHDLFERAREVCQSMGVPPAVRVLLAAHWSPVDRVRAELAGCEATLAQPVSRRDVARVLDANGVVLPRDPRRL
jgi:CheY-like chemotaxis protein